jgi:hypothetical protein
VAVAIDDHWGLLRLRSGKIKIIHIERTLVPPMSPATITR